MEGKKNFMRLFRIWRQAAVIHFVNAGGATWHTVFGYAFGKILRMGFFVVFVLALFQNGKTIAGYDKGAVLLFWAMMNMMDWVYQMFWLRGLMTLARDVRTGEFDFVLTRPLSPLLWTAGHIFDIFDLITAPAVVWCVWFGVHHFSGTITSAQVGACVAMFGVALVLAFALCLMIASITFWTTEMYNAWWLMRDAVYAARFPPEAYPVAVRTVFTFIIPILVMTAFPTKALLGVLSWRAIGAAAVVASALLWVSLFLWREGLKHYASASS